MRFLGRKVEYRLLDIELFIEGSRWSVLEGTARCDGVVGGFEATPECCRAKYAQSRGSTPVG